MENFKQWLENNENEPHPYEKWHGEYMNAWKNHRPMYGYGRKTPTPLVDLDKMKQDPRAKNAVVEVLSIKGESVGFHGYENEEMADDPFKHAEWEIKIDIHTERKLVGKNAFIMDDSGGSFHEKWGRMHVFVIVNDIMNQPDNEKLNWHYYPDIYANQRHEKIVKFFKFQSIRQASDLVKELEPHISFPGKEGETSEDYWKRVMKSVETPPDPIDQSGYDSRDDYYKK